MPYRSFIPDESYALHRRGAEFPFVDLSGDELATLLSKLTKEHDADTNYYINARALQYLGEAGLHPRIVNALLRELGEARGIEIEWV